MFLRFQIFLIIFLILQSCTSIKTVAPEESYTPIEIKPKLSTVNVPINIPLKDIEKSVNKYLTGVLYEDNNLSDDDMEMKVWKDGLISVDMVGEEFRFKVPIKVWLKAGFKAEKFGVTVSDYEETNCSMVMDFVSKATIAPDYSLKTHTVLSKYEWKQKPVLDFGLFSLPLTYVADKIIKANKESLLTLLDDEAAKFLQIKPYLDDAWKAIQEPIKVYDSPPSYVSVRPIELKMTPLMGRAGLVQSSIGMKAYTQLHVGQKPFLQPSKMPNLTMDRNESGIFTFSLLTEIEYEEAEALTKKYFQGYIFEFSKKKKVRIDSINLYGNKGKLVLNVKVSGSLKGNLFLSAIPYYDVATKSIKVKQVTFDLDTKNKLIKSADWFAHDLFIKKIESAFVYSIKQDLEDNKKLIEESVFNKKVYDYYNIEGSLIHFEPEELFLTESGIAALMLVKGTLSVTVTDF